MSLKDIKTTRWTIEEANRHLQQNFTAEYWAFLVIQLNYKEVKFENKQIVFAEYLPMKTLISEVLHRIAQGGMTVIQCEVCQQFFDINKQEGIFGDNAHLKRFICHECSHQLSAWEFYHQYLLL